MFYTGDPDFSSRQRRNGPLTRGQVKASLTETSLCSIGGGFFCVKQHVFLYEDAHLHTDKNAVIHQRIRLCVNFKVGTVLVELHSYPKSIMRTMK